MWELLGALYGSHTQLCPFLPISLGVEPTACCLGPAHLAQETFRCWKLLELAVNG